MAIAFARVMKNRPLLKSAQMLDKVQRRIYDMQTIFHYFINNTWIFESVLDEKIMSLMTKDELREFNFDMRQIDWRKSLAGYCFGIRRFYFKEDCMPFEAGFEQVLAQNQYEWFHDVRLSRQLIANSQPKDNKVYFASMLS